MMATVQVKMSSKRTWILTCCFFMGFTAVLAVLAPAARADEPVPSPGPSANLHPDIGGHIGIATTLVTLGSEKTTTISDQFTLAFPIGIGFKLTDKVALDFETVVGDPVSPKGTTSLTVDPGLVYDMGSVVIGLRVAWAIQANTNFGLIPLVHKGVADVGHGATWFVEAAFPTFISAGTTGTGAAAEDKTTFAFNVVVHTGIGF
jgi:hypothetical protein